MIESLRSSLSRLGTVLRAVAGVPDYDRYLAHMRSVHSAERAMTETEFNASRLHDRYDRLGSRCC